LTPVNTSWSWISGSREWPKGGFEFGGKWPQKNFVLFLNKLD
jgi:hypothetical protein